MPTLKILAGLLLAGAVGACASLPSGSPEAIARLEREQRGNPTSAAANRTLGIAYYKGGRYADARRALETARRLDPRDGSAILYLGLTAEAQQDFAAAKQAYASYLSFGRATRVRAQLESRLAALTRRELATQAREAIAQESKIGASAASPRVVAVMPLRFSGADSSLKPLERGFADLLITDLARSPQLTLVERDRLQALLDELALADKGVTDASTSARAGRLLRAGRVVQGTLLQVPSASGASGPTLRADAAVVDVPTSRIRGTARGADVLDQLFGMEKKLALDLFQQLGVTLTLAERNAIEERPTRSLAAFLAYSRGLSAEDAGRFDEAARYFNEAVRVDPGFRAAQDKRAEAARLTIAATPATVEASIRAAEGGSGASGGGTLAATAEELVPSPAAVATGGGVKGATPAAKDNFSEGTNTETAGSAGGVFNIVRQKP